MIDDSGSAVSRPPATSRTERTAVVLAWGVTLAFLAVPPGVYLAASSVREKRTVTGTLWVEEGTGPDHAAELERALSAIDPSVVEDFAVSPGWDRGLVQLSLTSSTPRAAADILNALMLEHVERVTERQADRLRERVTILEQQLSQVEHDLAETESRLEAFRVAEARAPSDGRPHPSSAAEEDQRLQRRVESVELLYNEIRGRLEAARLARREATRPVRIVSPARTGG